MKIRPLLIITLVFLLLINTSYFWEYNIGSFLFLVYGIFILLYIVLLVVLVFQLNKAIRERGKNKTRIVNVSVLAATLIIVLLYPSGIINFKQYETKPILLAQREGVANCTTTYKFLKDSSFERLSICFGLEKLKGRYARSGDTLLLTYQDKKKEIAVIGKNKYGIDFISVYKHSADTIPIEYAILKSNK